MGSPSRSAVLFAACITLPIAFAGPVQLEGGVQGADDEFMAGYIKSNFDDDTLSVRYQNLKADINPGVLRYNAFWSDFESGPPPSPAGTPPAAGCPPFYTLVPSNEVDRIKRGYNHYHCYSDNTTASFDDLLARDAAIGAASTFISYGSPDWAIHQNCTGFPWGSTYFKLGCLPWNNLEDWYDYVLYVTERWNAPWGSGKARLSGMVIWNEVQSQGWADPSPVLPNRYSGPGTWSAQDYQTYGTMIANLTLLAGRAAYRNMARSDFQLWLSTDHFATCCSPGLNSGDVMHIGLYDVLDVMWPIIGTSLDWGVAVHPYDAGDPRQNLTARGIYTFATLKSLVSDYQCAKLGQYAGVDPSDCGNWPQTAMFASEQGWPFNNVSMTKADQARNICYAHALSLALGPSATSQGVWSVTHNFFQASGPTNQGDSGDFSLVDYPPTVWANLSNGRPGPQPWQGQSFTYRAYMATSPMSWGKDASNYCCTAWQTGCPAST